MDSRLLPPWLLFPHADLGDVCSVRHNGVVLDTNLPIEEARAILSLSRTDEVATRGFVRIISDDRETLRELAARNAVLREALELVVEGDLHPDVAARARAALVVSGEALLARLRESEDLAAALSAELSRLGVENATLRASK